MNDLLIELAALRARAEWSESEVKRLRAVVADATGRLVALSSATYHLAEVTRAVKRWEDALWGGQMEPQPAPLSLMQSIDSALNALPFGSPVGAGAKDGKQ